MNILKRGLKELIYMLKCIYQVLFLDCKYRYIEMEKQRNEK